MQARARGPSYAAGVAQHSPGSRSAPWDASSSFPGIAGHRAIAHHRAGSTDGVRALQPGGLRDRPGVAAMLIRALEGALALQPGLVVERQVELFVRLGEDLAAAAQHDPGGLEDLVKGEARC